MKVTITGSKSFDFKNLASGADTGNLPFIYDYLEVTNYTGTDGLIYLNEVPTPIPVYAGTKREIKVQTFRVRVSGTTLEVIGYLS